MSSHESFIQPVYLGFPHDRSHFPGKGMEFRSCLCTSESRMVLSVIAKHKRKLSTWISKMKCWCLFTSVCLQNVESPRACLGGFEDLLRLLAQPCLCFTAADQHECAVRFKGRCRNIPQGNKEAFKIISSCWHSVAMITASEYAVGRGPGVWQLGAVCGYSDRARVLLPTFTFTKRVLCCVHWNAVLARVTERST